MLCLRGMPLLAQSTGQHRGRNVTSSRGRCQRRALSAPIRGNPGGLHGSLPTSGRTGTCQPPLSNRSERNNCIPARSFGAPAPARGRRSRPTAGEVDGWQRRARHPDRARGSRIPDRVLRSRRRRGGARQLLDRPLGSRLHRRVCDTALRRESVRRAASAHRAARLRGFAYAYAFVFFTSTVVYALAAGSQNWQAVTDVFGSWLTVHGVIMVISGIAFGLAVIKAATLPGWTGICLIVGVALVAATAEMPNAARTVAAALPDAAFIGMGGQYCVSVGESLRDRKPRCGGGVKSRIHPGRGLEQQPDECLQCAASTTLAESVPFPPQHHDPRALRTGVVGRIRSRP